MKKMTAKLIDFVMEMTFSDLPEAVVKESKKLLLDSIGVAIAGVRTDKGKYAIELAKQYGGPLEASILGTSERVGCANAAFANAEIMVAMDYEAFGGLSNHYVPFLLPSCLAFGETARVSGKELILSIALGSELSVRFPKAIRGTKRYFTTDHPSEVGKIIGTKYPVSVLSTPMITGAIAAALLKKLDYQKMLNLVGIIANFLPIPQTKRWEMPVWPLLKWGSGWASMGEVTATIMADIGYTADNEPIDGELGLWRFYGSDMWDPNALFDGLGHEWTILETLEYKPYPVFRPIHIALDCFKKIIEDNNLMPDDITMVKIQTNPGVAQLYNSSKTFPHNVATQSSIPYAIASIANRTDLVDWQNPDKYSDPEILSFFDKVFVEPHPRFEEVSLNWEKRPGSTLTMVEVITEKAIYREEGEFAVGCPYPEWARMTEKDIIEKFYSTASVRISKDRIDNAVAKIMEIEKAQDFSEILKEVTLR